MRAARTVQPTITNARNELRIENSERRANPPLCITRTTTGSTRLYYTSDDGLVRFELSQPPNPQQQSTAEPRAHTRWVCCAFHSSFAAHAPMNQNECLFSAVQGRIHFLSGLICEQSAATRLEENHEWNEPLIVCSPSHCFSWIRK